MLDRLKNNSLQANPSKFQSMLLKSKTVNAEDFNIIVDNYILNLTDDMTVLGINIDNKLNFNSHVSSMCNKAGRQLKKSVQHISTDRLNQSSRLNRYTLYGNQWKTKRSSKRAITTRRGIASCLNDGKDATLTFPCLQWLIMHFNLIGFMKTFKCIS